MARPQKPRHALEELSDPKIAEKLGRLVIEIEDLHGKRKKLDELLAAAFDAVDDAGFEKKFVRKVVALRAKDQVIRQSEEDGLETYEFAIEKGVSLARTRRKPANDDVDFDPATGEVFDETHQRPSTNDEPSPEAGPQAEASPAGTGSGTLADREGRSEGEAASSDLPTFPKAETSREASPAAETVMARRGADASKVVCPALTGDAGGMCP